LLLQSSAWHPGCTLHAFQVTFIPVYSSCSHHCGLEAGETFYQRVGSSYTVKNIVSRVLTPVILATQEAEIRRIVVRPSPGQIVHETLSWKYPSWCLIHSKNLCQCYNVPPPSITIIKINKYKIKKKVKGEIWPGWFKPVILAFGRLRLEDHSLSLAQAKSLRDPNSTYSWAQWYVSFNPSYKGKHK
jgi:hypothetical protein